MTRLLLRLLAAIVGRVPTPRVALECDHHGWYYPQPGKGCPSCALPPEAKR